MKERDPLEEWEKKTLWFRVKDGPLVTLDVWIPPNASEKEIEKLLQKQASQMVRIIRELTGTETLIFQGQYQDE